MFSTPRTLPLLTLRNRTASPSVIRTQLWSAVPVSPQPHGQAAVGGGHVLDAEDQAGADVDQLVGAAAAAAAGVPVDGVVEALGVVERAEVDRGAVRGRGERQAAGAGPGDRRDGQRRQRGQRGVAVVAAQHRRPVGDGLDVGVVVGRLHDHAHRQPDRDGVAGRPGPGDGGVAARGRGDVLRGAVDADHRAGGPGRDAEPDAPRAAHRAGQRQRGGVADRVGRGLGDGDPALGPGEHRRHVQVHRQRGAVVEVDRVRQLGVGLDAGALAAPEAVVVGATRCRRPRPGRRRGARPACSGVK